MYDTSGFAETFKVAFELLLKTNFCSKLLQNAQLLQPGAIQSFSKEDI
jgi:hypothetical protein